jgi:hypothetical protein
VKPDINAAEAVERLVDFDVRCALSEGHVRQAQLMVSRSGAEWEKAGEGEDPEDILDATALLAHYVSLDSAQTAGVTSERVMQASQSYATPKRHPSFLAAERLLLGYGGELSGGFA